ncbi:unnamed protein product [Clavelina lepadiformis]|uniref:Protein phosphatase 1 regulatory subunit 35 C-terminal domain-containing protein n=1 Tax=Clavelina lepadiformis TaxID=159417 RepID=A0ABP0GG85_CLALP
MSSPSNVSLHDGSYQEDLKKASELDLIPTKITAVHSDPSLLITPEKPPVHFRKIKSQQKNVTAYLPPVVEDPDLFITPEKLPSLLKTKLTGNEITKPQSKNKVRFDIPDSSDDTLIESPVSQSACNDSSSISTEFEEGSSHGTEDTSDFSTKAALLTQRNPLADITLDHNVESSNASMDFNSTNSSSSFQQFAAIGPESNYSQILDMHGKKLSHPEPVKKIVEPTKPYAVTRIKVARGSEGHRKNTLAQQKIDKLTTNLTSGPNETSIAISTQSLQIFLKKKSGLQRHSHSVKYISKSDDQFNSIPLEQPKYNSSLAMGQKLQHIKEEKFDALQTMKKKLEEDPELKAHVTVKASAGTNIDPEDMLFKNLVSVDVPLSDVMASAEFRRIKRPSQAKPYSPGEPNILDMFPADLIQEKVVLDSKCFSLPCLNPTLTPLDTVMSLYDHSLSWNELNSY